MGLSLFFFGICEQLDVFDICVTGHCSSRLAQKLRCPDQLCVCVCVYGIVFAHQSSQALPLVEKNTQTHTSIGLFLIPIATVMRYILTPTMSVCQVVSLSLSLFLLCIHFVSFSPFSSASFFPSLRLSQAFKSRLSMNSACYFVL